MNSTEAPDLHAGTVAYARQVLDRARDPKAVKPGVGTVISAAMAGLEQALTEHDRNRASEDLPLTMWILNLGLSAHGVMQATEGLIRTVKDERGPTVAAYVRGTGEAQAA